MVVAPTIMRKQYAGMYILRRIKRTSLGTLFVETSRSRQYYRYRPKRIFKPGFGRVELWVESRYYCRLQCVLIT